jgi:TolB protein
MMKTKTMQKILYLLLFLLVSQLAHAKLEIEIIQGNASALPIAIVPMQWRASDPRPQTGVADVVASDLYRSGLFDPLDEQDMVDRPVDAESIRYGTWRLLKVDYLVIGHVADAPGGNGYDIVYQLFDVHTQESLLSQITTVGFGDLRFGAHRVADAIYEKLTGVPGAFSTRIAYISATGEGIDQNYQLFVADADGFNPQAVVGSPEPLLSPNWSPDGERLAYVSFEKGNSAIYVQNVATGQRELASAGKGINGEPAFSPDGR